MYKECIFPGKFSLYVINEKGELCCGGYFSTGFGDEKKRIHLEKAPIPENKRIKTLYGKNTRHFLFVSEDGTVYATGANYSGQCGIKNNQKVNKITEIKFFRGKKVKSVRTFLFASMVILENHNIFVFGSNEHRKLGINYKDEIITPKKINLNFLDSKSEFIIDIKGGEWHSLFLSSIGNVYSAGNNFYGQTCSNSMNINTISKIDQFENKGIKIKQISAGSLHSLFLSKDNKAYSAGYNLMGQLGNNNQISTSELQEMNLQNIIKVVAGDCTSFFLTSEKVFACGWNHQYQLGIVKRKDVCVPVCLNWRIKFVDVAVSQYSTFFVGINGFVYVCGYNNHGKCCVGNTDSLLKSPTKIPNLQIKLEKISPNFHLFRNSIYRKQRKCVYVDFIVRTNSIE